MRCQSCTNPATVHITTIEKDGKKRQLHLCQACAEKQNMLSKQELNLPAILQAILGQHVGPVADELARLACPECGIKFMEFRHEGRLGCPHDYTVFRRGLEPLLQRIHGGGRSVRHVGKSPRRDPERAAAHEELVELRRRLREAVEAERYEEAARLRDQLREREGRA